MLLLLCLSAEQHQAARHLHRVHMPAFAENLKNTSLHNVTNILKHQAPHYGACCSSSGNTNVVFAMGCSGQVTKGSKRLTAAATVHVDVMRSSLLLLLLLKSRSSVSATASDVRAMRFSSSNTHDSVVAFLWLMRGM